MRVALKGVEGVDNVDVSLNQGRATVKLKPGNHVTLAQLRAAVAKNGFANKEAAVVAVGDISADGGQLKFQVNGTAESFALSPSPAITLNPGPSVVVEGTVPPENHKVSGSMQIKSVKRL